MTAVEVEVDLNVELELFYDEEPGCQCYHCDEGHATAVWARVCRHTKKVRLLCAACKGEMYAGQSWLCAECTWPLARSRGDYDAHFTWRTL